MHTLLRYCPIDALKSLCDTYKFKLYTLKKSLFFGFFSIFLNKIAILQCRYTKNHQSDLLSYSKNQFSGLFSVVTERSLHCLSFKTSAKNHYFWFSLTFSSLLINSAPCTLFIIHIFIDPQTREQIHRPENRSTDQRKVHFVTNLSWLLGCPSGPIHPSFISLRKFHLISQTIHIDRSKQCTLLQILLYTLRKIHLSQKSTP